jgi:murein endopeptidase
MPIGSLCLGITYGRENIPLARYRLWKVLRPRRYSLPPILLYIRILSRIHNVAGTTTIHTYRQIRTGEYGNARAEQQQQKKSFEKKPSLTL